MKKMALLAEREAKKASDGLKMLLWAGLKGFKGTLCATWPIKTMLVA